MKYIKGNDRGQIALIPSSLEQAIDENNEVRIIDLFVDSLDLEDLGFRLDFGENGRPAYHSSDSIISSPKKESKELALMLGSSLQHTP